MASTWSSLKIELLETGQNPGQWGNLTNVNLGDAVLGEAITGQATVDFASDADVTITLTDSATSQAARNLRLNITESSTGVGSVRNLILGSGCQIEKFYLINNTGTGAKTVKNTSGTGITVPAGKATLVYNNGTNVVDAASYFTSLTLGSALPVASGGTGLTAGTSGGILGYTATGTLASSVALTANALVLGAGAGATPTPMASLGTTTTVLHGNASGAPTFGAVSLTADVTGVLPTANGGTNLGGATPFTSGGVVYASSTSALATGSGLTFDGTNLATTGYASAVGLRSLTGGGVRFNNAGNTNFSFITAPAGTGDMQFDTGAGEGMRLTSTGLGIGTSSPITKLQVNGITTTTELNTANDGIRLQSNFVTKSALNVASTTNQGVTGTAVGDFYQWTTGGKFLWSSNSGTTAHLVLDGSGNLGLGVTPSAFGSGRKALQLGGAGYVIGVSQIDVGVNYYYDTAYKYVGTGFASSYQSYNGLHAWYTAASGTAGNTISFTQAMTLDASGNLGIGTTSPASKLHLVSNNADDSGGIRLERTSGTTGRYSEIISSTGDLTFTETAVATRLTLQKTTGNLGIGTTSPAKKLDVNGDALINGLTVGKGASSVANNTAFGGSALGAITSGDYNVAIGKATGDALTDGGVNVAVGSFALSTSISGAGNTAIGHSALENSTGNFNTTVGYNSGKAITTGQYNTIVGYYNGLTTESNMLVLADGQQTALLTTKYGYSLALADATMQSGGGITFPATQSASSDANTLDDYEEGTWTPDATVGFTIVGATVASGSYTKIGNLVQVTGILGGATTIASAGGNTRITGMPFTSVSNSNCAVALVLDDISFLSSGLFAGTTAGIYVPAFSATAADLVFQFSYRV